MPRRRLFTSCPRPGDGRVQRLFRGSLKDDPKKTKAFDARSLNAAYMNMHRHLSIAQTEARGGKPAGSLVANGTRPTGQRVVGPLARLVTWWAGLFVVLGRTGTVCPFCGQPGCPGGLASNGILAGLATIVLMLPRWIGRIGRKRSTQGFDCPLSPRPRKVPLRELDARPPAAQ